MTSPAAGQQVTTHYVLYLDDCTLIDSSRDREEPFTFIIGEGRSSQGPGQISVYMFIC